MLAKLLPERHNLYGNSLDFKLNICKKKMMLMLVEMSMRTIVTNSMDSDAEEAVTECPTYIVMEC